jgi:class 3 adenylate cyclase
MGLQRKQHRQFISDTAIQHRGSIFQEEGDAYLIEFPSVTDAVLAAMDMHQNLRILQVGKGEKQRLAIRAVITVGDILHQERDTIGMAMNLTARIEKITPADEIYLSQAAWLALNKAEMETTFVDEFHFKGFVEPEKIYKVISKHGIREITDQYIVLADANGFSNFLNSNGKDRIESFLLAYDELMITTCEAYGGMIRQVNGDLYFMTFTEANQTLEAISMICRNWKTISERFNIGILIGAHKGKIYAFRSYVFGDDINITMVLSNLGRLPKSSTNQISAVISGSIGQELRGSEYEEKLEQVDRNRLTQDGGKTILREHGAYQFRME